jgi:hypothetical protein
MAITFPSSPSTGQVFTAGNRSWTWDGSSWKGGVASTGDAGTLDGLDSTDFIRSNQSDVALTGGLSLGSRMSVGLTSAESLPYYSNKLVLEVSSQDGITIAANDTSATNYLMFADGTSGDARYRGYIEYNHNTENLAIAQAAIHRLNFSNTEAVFNEPGNSYDFRVESDTITSALYVKGSNGNVGIGTNNPLGKLHVGFTGRAGVFIGSTNGAGSYLLLDGAGNGDGAGSDYAYIEHESSGKLAFNVGNGSNPVGERMTIEPGGKVGIGTTNPQRKLHIVENSAQLRINRTDGGDDTWELYSWDDGLNVYPVDGPSTVWFGRDGQNTDVTLYNGRLAVNHTGAPPAAYAIYANGSIWAKAGAGDSGGLRLHTNSGINVSANVMSFHTGQTNGFSFNGNSNGADGSNPLAVIRANGNVGIGVTNPATPLQIYQSTNATGGDQKPTPVLTLSAHTNSDNEGPAIEFNSAWVNSSSYLASTINNGWGVAKIAGVYDDDQGNGGALSFYTNEGPSATSGATSSQLTEKMRIKPNGNVGIGTTTPNEKLQVEGSIRASGNIGVTQTDGDYLAKLYQTSADGFLELYTGEATPVSRVKLSSYGNSYIAPSTNSRLGVGTTNPAGRLHVLGTGGASSTIQLESSGTGNTVLYMKGANGNDFWGMFTGSSGGGFTLKDETNAKDAFNARPQGKMSYPSQTRFSAYSNNASTSYSAAQPFVMNLVRNNINNRYNTSNGIFVADVAGYYQFRFNAYSYNTGQWSVLYWNGSSISYYYDTNGTTSGGDHTVLCSVVSNSVHHMAWTMYLASGTGCAVGWRSGYSGSIYRSHAQFSGELISAD